MSPYDFEQRFGELLQAFPWRGASTVAEAKGSKREIKARRRMVVCDTLKSADDGKEVVKKTLELKKS